MRPTESTRQGRLLLVALLLIGVLAHTFRITAPLMEYRHFRQLDTAAMARNFHEGRMNILYPQVDWRGDTPGYAEAEFQIYTYAVALLYKIFGAQEWVGRALNTVLYALSGWLLYLLVRKLYDERSALLAVFFYSASPLVFYYTRAFQNDATTSLCSIAAVYFFWTWTEGGRMRDLALSAAGVAVAALIKPPSLYLGLPLCFLAYQRFGWRFLARPLLWGYAVAAILPAILWYRFALSLYEDYGNTFGILGKHTVLGMWGPTDWRWLDLLDLLIERATFVMATPAGLLFLAIGFLARGPRKDGLLLWWVAGFAVYILLVPRGHRGHEHYQLPIMFAVAAFMARGASLLLERGIFSRATVLLVCLLVLAGSVWKVHRFLFPWPLQQEQSDLRMAFAERVQALTDPRDLMIFVVPEPFPDHPDEIYRHRFAPGLFLYCDPRDFYLAHRKGWSLDDTQATPAFLDVLRERGARSVGIFDKEQVFERQPELKAALELRHTPLEVTDRWALYRLEPLQK